MSLDEFLHNLHFNIDEVISMDKEVDWDQSPLAYKLYRDLPMVPLSLEVPLKLEGRAEPVKPDLRSIGHFLWYIFGLTQFCQSVNELDATENTATLMQSYRRFVPSGGALYPNELYMYLKLADLPAGVYHYDVAHHSLVLLREGNFDSYIAQALDNRCEVSACFGTVFVSTIFWKNFFKYNHFSYRLQGLDAGVLMGQLLEVAKYFGYESGVYYQFLDRAINHLLGISEQEENVYAVIPLTVEPTNWSTSRNDIDKIVSATDLCRDLPALSDHEYEGAKRITEYPLLTKINEASMLESTNAFRKVEAKENMGCDGEAVVLPYVKPLSYDLASVCQERYSPGMDFVLGKVSQLQLATLLQEAAATFSYRNDLERAYEKNESRVSLYGCLYNVEGIPDGAYSYDSASHTLRQVELGDYRLQLQNGLSSYNVNLIQVPLCLHVIGDKDHLKTTFGYRGYRIQQMEAGMLVQRLLLKASAFGMGGHPLLGFDSKTCDEIYKIDSKGKTSLIQVPIGPYRNRPWLRGSLRS